MNQLCNLDLAISFFFLKKKEKKKERRTLAEQQLLGYEPLSG